MLQCHICNKPFTSVPSHTRHVSYCRRTRNRLRIRQRSCQACSVAKAKCSFQRPRCRRCELKGIECVYEPAFASSGLTTQLNQESPVDDAHSQGLGEAPGSTESWQASTLNGTIDWSGIDFGLLNEFLSEDAESQVSIDMPFAIGTSEPRSKGPKGPFEAQSPRHPTSELQEGRIGSPRSPHTFQQPSPSLTRTNPAPIDPCSEVLSLRRNLDASSRYSALSIIRGIRAYPLMMLQKDTFPPFIHLYSISSQERIETGPGRILARCMSIAHMYALRTTETKQILWEAISDQNNQFLSDLEILPIPDLLAAIQAQLVYMIMRIVDQAAQPLGMNYSLMLVFKALCEKFVSTYDEPFCYRASTRSPARWEDWIVAESWRRMKCIFFLISRVVDVDIGRQCPTQGTFDHIPLPSPRAQWESKTAAAWESQSCFASFFNSQSRHQLDTIGSLINAHKTVGPDGVGVVALDNWNVGVDSLGSLLNASLDMVV